jgi:AraC-like DNA-binding protein
VKFEAYIPTKLTGIVDLIWEHEIPRAGNYTILPSGKVELIFPFQPVKAIEAVKIGPEDNPVNNHTGFLSGLHTKPLKMSFDTFHTLGIQMKPVAVKALFGMPLCEIRNYFIEGRLVLENMQMIEDLIHAKNSFLDRAQGLENYLVQMIHESAKLHEAIHIDKAIRKYFIQKLDGSSKSIQDMMGYSRTQTYRLFNEWFGISAHSYQKLLQCVHTIESLHNEQLQLKDAGHENGYYDQSHCIHAFQEFTDMTPGQYRRQMSEFPGLIFSTTDCENEVFTTPAKLNM